MPLHFINEENSPAVKTDKLRRQPRRHRAAKSQCLASQLPEFLTVDLGELAKGQSLHVSDIKLAAGIKVVTHGKPNPVIVVGRRAKAEEEEVAPAPVVVAPPRRQRPRPRRPRSRTRSKTASAHAVRLTRRPRFGGAFSWAPAFDNPAP